MLEICKHLRRAENQPHVIAFVSSQGVEVGRVIEWLGKAWQVETKGGGCFVLPYQVLWME